MLKKRTVDVRGFTFHLLPAEITPSLLVRPVRSAAADGYAVYSHRSGRFLGYIEPGRTFAVYPRRGSFGMVVRATGELRESLRSAVEYFLS